MGIGWRSFIFEADGTVRRLSQSLLQKLAFRAATLPEYAGQSLRHALVHLDLDHRGRPVKICKIEASVFHFDETGSIKRSLADAALTAFKASEALTEPKGKPGSVVDMTTQFDRKKFEVRYRWVPGSKEITQMTDFIWRPGPKRRMQKKRPRLAILGNATLEKEGQDSPP